MNKAAQQLGRLAKGKPKNFSDAERRRRAERLAKVRQNRWPGAKTYTTDDQVLYKGKLHQIVQTSAPKKGKS